MGERRAYHGPVRSTGAERRGAWEPSWPVLCGFVLVLSLGFLGSRGLWEPDEGRYAAVAWEMAASGDYVTPTLNGVPHFTKPPLTYWTVAAGLAALGRNEWGARLGLGLAFAATALLVARFGEALWGPARGRSAAVLYATMGLPFFAGSAITPDTLLTLGETAALFAFWRGWTADSSRSARWWAVGFWASLGVAFMTKGPPALLTLLVVLPVSVLARPPRAPVTRAVWLRPAGPAVFLLLTRPWFVIVATTYPGLADYLLRDEVVGRLATRVHHRNSQWHMGLWIYPAAALLGALPWSLTWPLAVAPGSDGPRGGAGWPSDPGPAAPSGVDHRSDASSEPRALPSAALIFCPSSRPSRSRRAARSPAFATPTHYSDAAARGGSRSRACACGVRACSVSASRPRGIRHRRIRVPSRGGVGPCLASGPAEVIIVDRRIYGLPFYLNAPLEVLASRPERVPEYQPTTEPWDEEVAELSQVTYRHVFVRVPRRLYPAFAQRVADQGAPCREEAGHRDLRLIVCEPVP